jgi:transcriptional regulator with XRE-family HTH domain
MMMSKNNVVNDQHFEQHLRDGVVLGQRCRVVKKSPEPTITGRRIKEARTAIKNDKGKPMSLRALADLAGMDAGVISRIESGATQHAEGETLKKLAPHLRVSVDWLLATEVEGALDATPPTPPAKSGPRLSSGEERDDVEYVDAWFFEALQNLRGRRHYTPRQGQAAKRFLAWGSNKLKDNSDPSKMVMGALEAARELDETGREMSPENIFALLVEKNAPPSGPESGAREHDAKEAAARELIRKEIEKSNRAIRKKAKAGQ